MRVEPTQAARWIITPEPLSEEECRQIEAAIAHLGWSGEDWRQWFLETSSAAGPHQRTQAVLAERMLDQARQSLVQNSSIWDSELVAAIANWFHRAAEWERISSQLLSLLAGSSYPPAVDIFVSLLLHRPPQTPSLVAAAFQPLFRADCPVDTLFPRLLDALSQPSLAAAVLDLANYLTRRGIVSEHPARERAGELVGLMGSLVRRLEQCEEQQVSSSQQFHDVARQVAEAIAITIALCDALALIGVEEAIPKLYPLLEIRHRRLQVEAAAALARLGDETGKEKLKELAAEPVVRLYAVQFAQELGFGNEIAEEHRSPEALMLGRAALMLAQPTYFGVAPSYLELLDVRRIAWPGEEMPVEVALVRYAYTSDQGEWSNVAAVGPTVGICTADLADLAPDDIYAIFAGMEMAHEEIRHWDQSEWTEYHVAEIARLERRLRDRGYLQIEPQLLGAFFGQWFLIAKAQRESTEGIAIADDHEVRWFPTTGDRPLGVRELLALYQGRKFFEAFPQREDIEFENGGEGESPGDDADGNAES